MLILLAEAPALQQVAAGSSAWQSAAEHLSASVTVRQLCLSQGLFKVSREPVVQEHDPLAALLAQHPPQTTRSGQQQVQCSPGCGVCCWGLHL